ncbi:hypothetical protein [uncultured Dokdonia sp.]|uniref:hypothetical protein n=1 Tax=uncultured Dokdonia sp. TaxID=575653 RepID=UPI002613D753|nr:hypothetical protein [uncultured Dokdonia sp.]
MKTIQKITYLIILVFTNQMMAQTDAITILPNGNVGIGAMTPTQKLDVNGNIRVSGNINAQGTVQAQQLSVTSIINTTRGKIQENNNDLITKGTIIMWHGDTTTIPKGWAICNGNNDTPDLRNQFIVDAGESYSVNNTRGQARVALTVAEMPRHSHSVFTGVRDMGNSYDRDSKGRHPAHWDGSTRQTTSTQGSGNSHENRHHFQGNTRF